MDDAQAAYEEELLALARRTHNKRLADLPLVEIVRDCIVEAANIGKKRGEVLGEQKYRDRIVAWLNRRITRLKDIHNQHPPENRFPTILIRGALTKVRDQIKTGELVDE